jgi:hypothetical protein
MPTTIMDIVGDIDPDKRKRLSIRYACQSVRIAAGRIDDRLWGKRPSL